MRKLFDWQGGAPLLVDDHGTGSGLICLHGLGGGSYFFSGLAKALSGSRRVLSFDMPGTGFNAGTVEGFSIESCVDATLEMIDHAASEHVCLLGHSMGTIVALKAYCQRQDQVGGLIFVGGLPRPTPVIRDKLTQRIGRIQEVGMTGIGEEVMPGIFAESTLREKGQLVGTYQRLLEMNSPDCYIESIRALVEASAHEEVSRVNVPCLALTGFEDLYASPQDVQAFADSIPSEVTLEVFENCGHMIFYEAPGRFYESVNTFLHSIESDWTYEYGRDT